MGKLPVLCNEVAPEQDITDRQKLAVSLVARGLPDLQIENRTGIHRGTVARWRKEPWWGEMLQQEIDRLHGDPMEVFRPMIPSAIAAYERALEQDEDLPLAFRAAQDAFDRTYGKAIIRQQSQSVASVHIHIIDDNEDGSQYIEHDVQD